MLNSSVSTRMSSGAEKIITRSLTEALQLGHWEIRPEHLLLALLREAEGPAAKALARFPSLQAEIIRTIADESINRGKTAKDPLREILEKVQGLEKDLCDHIKAHLG